MEIDKQLFKDLPLRRHIHPNDTFFGDGNQAFSLYEKTVDEDIDFIIDSIGAVHIEEFSCTVKGCLKKFTSPIQFNRHYDMLHKYYCQTCSRNFPSNYLLSLHISENHDTYFEAQKEKGVASFYCLLESCGQKFVSEIERKNHLVTSHRYPPNFRFNAVKRTHKKYQQKETGNNKNKQHRKENSTKKQPTNKLANTDEGHELNTTPTNKQQNKKKNKTKNVSKKEQMEVETLTTFPEVVDAAVVVVMDEKRAIESMDTQPNVEPLENKKRVLPKSICFGRGIQRGFAPTRRKR